MSADLRVALWGAASLDNVGDRALFEATQQGLAERLPGVRIERFCPWSRGADATWLWVDRDGGWPGQGRFDAIVMLGGVFAGPPYLNVLMQPFTLGPRPERFDPQALVCWWGVGLDDSTPAPTTPEHAAYLRQFADRVSWFTVRGTNARDRFEWAGAPLPTVVPDAAFTLRPTSRAHPRTGARPRVALAVSDAAVSNRFLSALTEPGTVLRHVRQCGADRRICLPLEDIVALQLRQDRLDRAAAFARSLERQCEELAAIADVDVIAIDNMYDDARVARALHDRLPGARLHELRGAGADAVTELLGRYDVVVGSRLHTLLLAVRGGARVVAVDPYWDPAVGTSKVAQLMATLGVPNRHCTLGRSEPTLAEHVDVAWAAEPVELDAYARQRATAQAGLDGLAAAIAAARSGATAWIPERSLAWR